MLFNYDLLGYGMMALSTFFIGLSMNPISKADKWLKCLMMVHGVFFISCFIMPMTGVFTDMASGETGNGGTIIMDKNKEPDANDAEPLILKSMKLELWLFYIVEQ